jgi:alpha/beta superfamily hydrolase
VDTLRPTASQPAEAGAILPKMPRPLRVSIPGTDGRPQLAAVLDQPDGEVRGHAIYAHCFTCTKDIKAAYRFGQTLAGRGVALLRFDFSGLGGSEGDFSETNLSTNVDDLLVAAGWLRQAHGPARILIGHSLGGLAAIFAAGELPEVRAVVTMGTPYEPDHLRRRVGLAEGAAGQGPVEVNVAGRTVQLRGQLFEDLTGHDPAAALSRLGRPLLVCHAPEDAVVGVEQAEKIFGAARQPKNFLALDGANHLLDRREDAERAASLVLAWAERYL